MIAAMIFDLDNCLAPADTVGKDFFQPAFDAIRQANNGHLSEAALQHAFADMWRHALDWVAATHQFSGVMLRAGWNEFAKMEVRQPLAGYDDLPLLGGIPVKRFLVTSGFRRLQESKIRGLGIAPWFEKVIVDAVEEAGRIGKHGQFQKILEEYALLPDQVLVVGDNEDSEIAAGNRLGIITVQTLRPGVPKAASASVHIHSLAELRQFL